MKDEKKTVNSNKKNTPKKNNTSNKKPQTQNAPKKKPNNNVNKSVSEAPKVTKIESTVKETKKVVIDEDFIEEDNDKKLVVVIAIAILVILATIIGLLVGCEKKVEEEPKKPEEEEIVVPVEKEDEKEDEKVVVKVTTTKSDKEEEKEEIVIPTYDIIYYYNGNQKTHHESVNEGTAAKEYIPEGYKSCRYYSDENYSTEYTFDNLYKDVNIYLKCETVDYKVVYNYDETIASNNELNPETFTVEDEITLEDAITEQIFVGWYLDNEFTTKVTSLNRTLSTYADEENTIYLYAKITNEVKVELYNTANEIIYNETFTKEEAEGYTLPDAAELNVCATENQKFLGWATTEGSKNVEYKNKVELDLTKDYTLYAVCGNATIVYVSNGETITVGYTNEELLEEGFDLPAPSDLGMETPVYFVPVDEETLTSKKIVSDDEIELKENEVYFSQVVDNAIEGYVPTIGDNVEGFEKEFLGWIEKDNSEETIETEETVTEEITDEVETETTDEEYDFVTEEEVVDELTNSTEEEPEMELEAVWGIPEEETTDEPNVEVTTPEVETNTPEVLA